MYLPLLCNTEHFLTHNYFMGALIFALSDAHVAACFTRQKGHSLRGRKGKLMLQHRPSHLR